MKPSLNTGFSLANFFAELVELKTMFKLFDRNKSVIKNLAAGHLNWSFGWKPFVSDIQKIAEKISSFEDSLKRFKAQEGKIQYSHFKKALGKDTEEYAVLQSSSGCVGNQNMDFMCTTVRDSVFHATMRYKYSCSKLHQEWSRLRAFLDHFGLQFGPSFVWEAIPFSFVVDWFFGVGKYLQLTRTDSLNTKVEVLDFCYSTKAEYKKTWFRRCEGNVVPCAVESSSVYHRQRVLPDMDDLGVTLSDRYGTKQFVLSLALLLA
jgi:hypothetical protein